MIALTRGATRHVLHFWNGPGALPRSLQLEWRFVAVRWLGIFFMIPGLLLAHLSPSRLVAAYAVLTVAAVYNLLVQVKMVRRPTLFVSGYITAIGDGLLNIAMINIGSGFNSPFYYLLFTVTIAAAMRFGYGPSLSTVFVYVSLDAWETQPLAHGGVPLSTFIFRSGFLLITAVLGGYLREQAQRAEAALQERLRQANLLNAATATLGASLEFETVLHAVAAAARHLYGSSCAVLLPAPGLVDGVDAQAVSDPDVTDSTLNAEIIPLCARYAQATRSGHDDLHVRPVETLASGRRAMIVLLALPTRQTLLATLAVVAPPGQEVAALDPDIYSSFVERIALALENASLYRALAGRSTDLQRAYSDLATAHQELLSVDEMKTNFLANVSHELRTPLSSIRSFSELLLSYDDEPAVQQEFIQIINSESERLTRLVNDVLDITKIEAGKMDWHLTRVNLAALLKDAARTYAHLMAEHHLLFQQEIADDLPWIEADRDRLQQVVGNLLTNAIKFTPSGTITFRAARHGDEILVSVVDTGIGIAEQDKARIFEKFQQVGDTLTDKPRGTGLGLCICRDIVAYHKGRLWVESQPGAGSTFAFTLPATAAAAETVESVLPAA